MYFYSVLNWYFEKSCDHSHFYSSVSKYAVHLYLFFDETLIFLNMFLELKTQLGINMWNSFWVLYFFLMIYSAGFMQYRFVLIDSIL